MSPDIYVKCPLYDGGGTFGCVPDPNHPAGHTFTPEQAATLLRWMSAEDWEDGPRCLLDVLNSIGEGQ